MATVQELMGVAKGLYGLNPGWKAPMVKPVRQTKPVCRNVDPVVIYVDTAGNATVGRGCRA